MRLLNSDKMNACPICHRSMYQVFPVVVESDKLCPVHGEFKISEENRSIAYYYFVSYVNSLKQLEFAMTVFMDEKQVSNFKTHLENQGIIDIDDIITQRKYTLIDTVNMSMIILLKRSIEKYVKSIGYHDVGKFAEDKKTIIDSQKIKHPLTNDDVNIFNLITDLRNIFIHIFRNRNREYNPTFIDAVIHDLEDGNFSILRDFVVFNDFQIHDPIFARGLSLEEISNELSKRPTRNMDKTSYTTLCNYIVDAARKIILEIDEDIYKVTNQ